MKAKPDPSVTAFRKALIIRLINADPNISVRELAARVGLDNTSNVHYHIRRLMKAGLVNWLGTIRKRGQHMPKDMAQKRWDKGLVAIPRHTAAEQAALIEKVVAKAQGSGKNGEEDPGDDVIRYTKGPLFRNWRLRGCKF